MDEPEILTRLTENIREELQAQNALADLGLSDETLDSLAESIAANIDYAFEARWAPQWEGHRRPESN